MYQDYLTDLFHRIASGIVTWIVSLLPAPFPQTDVIIDAVNAALQPMLAFLALSAYFGNIYLFIMCVTIFWAIDIALFQPRIWIWLQKLVPFV